MTATDASANTAKLLGVLGLARRAGVLTTGTDAVCEALRSGKMCPDVVVEASDTSENTHKKLTDKCASYGVALYRIQADGEALAHAVGKTGSLAAASVRGELAKAVLTALGVSRT